MLELLKELAAWVRGGLQIAQTALKSRAGPELCGPDLTS